MGERRDVRSTENEEEGQAILDTSTASKNRQSRFLLASDDLAIVTSISLSRFYQRSHTLKSSKFKAFSRRALCGWCIDSAGGDLLPVAKSLTTVRHQWLIRDQSRHTDRLCSSDPYCRLPMSSPSLSPPSEGEIVESDLEKATTAIVSKKGNSVDRSFRKRVSVSRSPSPIRSPRRHQSRTDSRSPYRETRGAKRLVDDDHYDRSRNDPRRFKVRYEDRSQGSRSNAYGYYQDSNRFDGQDRGYCYEEQDATGRLRHKRPSIRSRSPVHGRSRREGVREHYAGESRDRHRHEQGDRGYRESQSRLSREQSVSDRGHSPVAAAQLEREAETRTNQMQRIDSSAGERSDSPAEYVPSPLGLYFADNRTHYSTAEKDRTNADRTKQPKSTKPADEATLIEERRKRREAIKARHRGQATPMLVQALALDTVSAPSTPMSAVIPEDNPAQGKLYYFRLIAPTNTRQGASPQKSPRPTSKVISGQESPTDFVVSKDTDLANTSAVASESTHQDEPSAADYDPTMDMQEDKMRHDEHQRRDEMPSGAYNETATVHQDVLIPHADIPKAVEKKADDGLDMFAEDDELDMFAEVPAASRISEKEAAKAVPIPQAKALDMSMLDDWDDSEGYYKVILGELLDGRYHVQSNLGKGMFSGVVRATDQNTKRLVAIKLIRNNETMLGHSIL